MFTHWTLVYMQYLRLERKEWVATERIIYSIHLKILCKYVFVQITVSMAKLDTNGSNLSLMRPSWVTDRQTDMAITVTLIIQEGYTCVYNVQLTNFAGFRILQNFWGEIYNAVVGMHMCLQARESVRRYPSNAPLCMMLRLFMKLFYKMLLHGVLWKYICTLYILAGGY